MKNETKGFLKELSVICGLAGALTGYVCYTSDVNRVLRTERNYALVQGYDAQLVQTTDSEGRCVDRYLNIGRISESVATLHGSDDNCDGEIDRVMLRPNVSYNDPIQKVATKQRLSELENVLLK